MLHKIHQKFLDYFCYNSFLLSGYISPTKYMIQRKWIKFSVPRNVSLRDYFFVMNKMYHYETDRGSFTTDEFWALQNFYRRWPSGFRHQKYPSSGIDLVRWFFSLCNLWLTFSSPVNKAELIQISVLKQTWHLRNRRST